MANFEVILRGHSINIRYTHRGNCPIPTGLLTDPEKYTGKHGSWIKGDIILNGKINKKLSELEQKATKYLAEYDCHPTAKEFLSYIETGEKKKITFDPAWQEFIYDKTHQGKESISIARLQTYARTKRYIDEFTSGVTFSDFTLTWATRWIDWLKREDFKQNSSSTMCKAVIAFFHYCMDQRIYQFDINVIRKLNLKKEQCDIIFHSIGELQAMLHCDLSKRPNLADTRDKYCLQCMVGLRVSDLFDYEWKESEDILRKKAIKTGEEIVIPLRSEARALIKRMLNREGGYRIIPDSDYNEEIKDVGRLAGLTHEIYFVHGKRKFKAGKSYPKNETMSSHVARSTFICQMIEAGVHYKMIMVMTGIKDVKTLDSYAAVMDVTLMATMDMVEKHQKLKMRA